MKFYLNAHLYHKLDDFRAEPCAVDKIIEIGQSEYALLYEFPLRDYDFISENKAWMRCDENGESHCLLVLGEGIDDGILICSEGYDYARYCTHIPNARQIVFMEQRYNCIQDLESCMTGAVDDVMSRANAHKGDEPYRVLIGDLMEKYQFEDRYIPLLLEMLGEHSGFEFEMDNDEIVLYTNYQQEKKEKPRHRPGEDELKVMLAKHVLWNHDEAGGEQADFSNMDLSDSYLVNSDLNGAFFKGAILNAATLGNGSYTFCDFTNADMYNVEAVDAVFEESDFTGAKLINCHFLSSHFTHCNFTDADLSGSDFNLASLDNSDFTGAKIDDAKLENTRMNNCTGLSAEPDEDESTGMTMQ